MLKINEKFQIRSDDAYNYGLYELSVQEALDVHDLPARLTEIEKGLARVDVIRTGKHASAKEAEDGK